MYNTIFESKDEILFYAYVQSIGLHLIDDKVHISKEGCLFGINKGKADKRYILKFEKREIQDKISWRIYGYGYPVFVELILKKFSELVSQDYAFEWRTNEPIFDSYYD